MFKYALIHGKTARTLFWVSLAALLATPLCLPLALADFGESAVIDALNFLAWAALLLTAVPVGVNAASVHVGHNAYVAKHGPLDTSFGPNISAVRKRNIAIAIGAGLLLIPATLLNALTFFELAFSVGTYNDKEPLPFVFAFLGTSTLWNALVWAFIFAIITASTPAPTATAIALFKGRTSNPTQGTVIA